MNTQNYINHFYILLTILLTLYSQLVIKFKVIELELLPAGKFENIDTPVFI